MSLLPKSLLAFGLLLASVLVPSGTALAANNSELQTLIRNCEAQNGKDCTELGSRYFHGIGVQQDLEKAAEYSAKGCELQNDSACGTLETIGSLGSIIYYNGRGVSKNVAKAVEYYTKGCELQNEFACEGLERSYSGNQDVTNVAQKYKQACDLNVAASCIDLASLYERGQGVEQNDAKAAEYYAKGTELMTPEERQKFFTERLDQNKADRTQQHEQIQQMQSEIETLRSFSLESEYNRNILQIQGNTN